MINFILGGLFFYAFLPILENFVELIEMLLDLCKARCGLKAAEYRVAAKKLENDADKNKIGFSPPNLEE